MMIQSFKFLFGITIVLIGVMLFLGRSKHYLKDGKGIAKLREPSISRTKVVQKFYVSSDEIGDESSDETNDGTSDPQSEEIDPRYILSGPQMKQFNPGEIPTTAHYVWCGDKVFTFADYLVFLSIVRILEPFQIFFYHNTLPKTDWSYYHSWFPDLQQSLANLVLKKIDRPINCSTMDAVDFALEQMASNKVGGVYVGERAVLTQVPDTWKTGKYFTYQKQGSSSSEDMIVFVKQGIDGKKPSDIKRFKNKVLSKKHECLTEERFENELSPCVVLPGPFYPEKILNCSTSFCAYLRWLNYAPTEHSVDSSKLVPLINHVIFLNPNPDSAVQWHFEKYVSVLSALYLARFERVYVYGNTEPSGTFWDRLKKENVTFVYVDRPDSVFQQNVNDITHKTDILRVLILYKHGGIYNDNDVIWVKPLSVEQRRYPTSGTYDWQQVDTWPRMINNGVIVSKPKALYLAKVLESFKTYRDEHWGFNSCYMYYKLYERFPESFHIDTRLQVGCYFGICHPVWHEGFQRVLNDRRPTTWIKIEEANAFHVFEHKNGVTFNSFSENKNRTNIEAVLLKRVMEAVQKAGKSHLLEDL
ncbi:uncharacterized protein LOC131931469 [Physella acuta]|uniref:uncharacterized protein LOC131931469 n=1 Tax=Physella acuta TaxID=109671 RepID=UPI0027DE0196|nr:uncharacterized protein LOC131931469 [Physella acuta]